MTLLPGPLQHWYFEFLDLQAHQWRWCFEHLEHHYSKFLGFLRLLKVLLVKLVGMRRLKAKPNFQLQR